MPSQKRVRIPYSKLSADEKNRINSRRRMLNAERREEENELFSVDIEDLHGFEVIPTAVGSTSHTYEAGQTSEHLTSIDDSPCLLYDVSVGTMVSNIIPIDALRQPHIPTRASLLLDVPPCVYCNAKKFPFEPPTFCCYKGQVDLYPVAVPDTLAYLYSGSTPESLHFLQFIKPYNTRFSFTSFGVHLDEDFATRQNGIYTFRAQGKIYHYINSLYPPSNGVPSYLQLYFYDTEHEVSNRKSDKDKLREATIQSLIDLLKDNPYSRFFRSLSDIEDIDRCQIKLKTDPKIKTTTQGPPTVSQVAAIWREDENGDGIHEREIIVQKHDGYSQRIKSYFGLYDPLEYPLLFPGGEPGWHEGIQRKRVANAPGRSQGQQQLLPAHFQTPDQLIARETAVHQENAGKQGMVSCREFYAYRLQIRESPNSILLQSGRLLQQFVVDMYVKIETSRLDYFRNKQDQIRADLYQGIVDSVNQGETEGSRIGKRIVLPGSFIGGPRDMRKKYMDAMALVEKYGKPDLFLTMTCNPKWEEIKGQLKPHEESHNRPDLSSRIFRSKFEQLRKEIVHDELFGPVQAYTYVVEYQKRGLPHVHMLIILKKSHKLNTAAKIDQFISAELPDRALNPHLYAMVVRHMMHGPCGTLDPSKPCTEKQSCKDHYPRSYSPETIINEDGYPTYRRRANNDQVLVKDHMLDNRWVVPYNPYLLAKYDCHMNIEVCSSIKAVKYLYKYIYKGHDKIIYQVVKTAQNDAIDEIEQFQNARWITPPEAVWRIYGFPLHQIHPAVIPLQLHLSGCQMVNFKDNCNLTSIADNHYFERTMLTQFFWMNANNHLAKALRLYYKDFPQAFVWNSQSRVWKERERQEVIGRIITANPSEGERYYLRLLLSHVKAPTSYEYLQTVNGVKYNSFRDAAVAYGLLEDDNSNEKCLEEASVYQMPSSMRQLFCTILVHCTPIKPVELFLKFETDMASDYLRIGNLQPIDARQALLQALNLELQSMGKNLANFQLHTLLTLTQENSQINREIEDELSIPISTEDSMSIPLLNTDQKIAYDAILDAVLHRKPISFFIDGPGGTGKTFLYRALLATIRSQHKIALATASSGVAASILPGGRTAHSRFKIPIDAEGKSCCSVSKQSNLGALLKQSALIIWDEASMAQRNAIEALDNLLKDLMDSNDLFGGKVIVLGGDFRQVLPVISKGTSEDSMNASLVRSYIWPSLRKYKLSENMRAKQDPAFCAYILRIGNGQEQTNDQSEILLPQTLVIEPRKNTQSLDELIEFVFPVTELNGSDPLAITRSAILTPKNDIVDEINEILMSKFAGQEQVYLSTDETTDPSQQGMYIDFLNSLSPQGMPPHYLSLKKNCPVLLLRNINPSKGLCNGTRLICREFTKYVIMAEIAVGERKNTIVFIPRIPLRPNNSSQYPVEFTRRQFPIRVCFAMTINKAQGQTLNKVGLYLPQPVFSHGQFYVGMSRPTTGSNIKVLLPSSETDPFSYYRTKNIVYKQILIEAGCQ